MSLKHEATLNGTINPNGLDTEVVFEYGTTPELGTVTPSVPVVAGKDFVPVVYNVTDLLPETSYYFKVTATNLLGTASGNVLQFTTPADTDVPSATTLDATNVS